MVKMPWSRKDMEDARTIAELSDPKNLMEDTEKLRDLVAETRDELSRYLDRLNKEYDLNRGKPREAKS